MTPQPQFKREERPEPEEQLELKPRTSRAFFLLIGSVLALCIVVAVVLVLRLSANCTEQAQPAPDDLREVEIAPGVKMVFCWVPKGECQLGSPKEEMGRYPDENEDNRGKFKTDGFWMGKYEVTQAEWKAVMGDNPSNFNGTKDNKAKGMDTSRFPVENVSWDMISGTGKHVGQGFLDKVNAHGGVRKAFGRDGKFALPHEDQWEYACRGGRGNERPFYWGSTLNGTEANVYGHIPHGTTVKGTNLQRTCAVDATTDTMGNTYIQHPWGLMHMHGNVWEWCENLFPDKGGDRVLRGGSWFNIARQGRAACRYRSAPDDCIMDVGFRVCLRLDF